MLGVMVVNERAFIPRADVAQEVELVANDVASLLRKARGAWLLNQVALEALRDSLALEPATWHCRPSSSEPWRVTLSPFLRAYEGVNTPHEYLERVVEKFTPVEAAPEPLHPSALSLPEAIDYLNVVWRLHARIPLLRIGRAEAAAKLVLDCATADEFESRLSALVSILDSVSLPDGDGKKLIDLDGYLKGTLAKESAGRASEAISDLRGVIGLRVWRQHAGTERRAVRGMQRLGITLPVVDWAWAWQNVQARAVAALSALREEIETMVPGY
jgi:hypothetical protein